jgi:hypothetical protein
MRESTIKFIDEVFINPQMNFWTKCPAPTQIHNDQPASSPLVSTVVNDKNIRDLAKLRELSVYTVSEDRWIFEDHVGTVDVWPERRKKAGKWTIGDAWAKKKLQDVEAAVMKNLGAVRFGATLRWGKPVLRAVVPAAKYVGIDKACRALGLTFERVTQSPVSVISLTVKAVRDNVVEGLALAAAEAREAMEKDVEWEGVEWGQQTRTQNSITVLGFVPRRLRVADHYSKLFGHYRVTVTPNFTEQDGDKDHIRKIGDDARATALPTEEERKLPPTGDDGLPDEAEYKKYEEAVERHKSLTAEIDAVVKTAQSWRTLHLPEKCLEAAAKVVQEIRKDLHTAQVDKRAEFFASYPTPGQLRDHLAARAGVQVDSLEELAKELEAYAQGPKPKFFSTPLSRQLPGKDGEPKQTMAARLRAQKPN